MDIEPLALVKLDYDAGDPIPFYMDLFSRLRRAGHTVQGWKVRRSPGGEGWHMKLVIDPPAETPTGLVALQALCGSDPHREASNLLRARALDDMPDDLRTRWNVLYKA